MQTLHDDCVNQQDDHLSPTRVAVVVTHPIQYFGHVYRSLGSLQTVNLRVLFGSTMGATEYRDPGFGVQVRWDCDLLGGFDHQFLPGADSVRTFSWKSLASVHVDEALADFDPDTVLLHGYSNPLMLRAWRWAKKHRRRIVMFGDGNGRTEASRPLVRRCCKRALLKPVLSHVDCFVTLGEANELYWRTLGVSRERMTWAPMYIPPPEITLRGQENTARARSEVRSELGIAAQQMLVICSGKFLPRKRQIDLIQAIDRCNDVVGLYVGDGTERRACQAAVGSDRHRFLGFVNVPRLAELYAAADLLCHPAESEPYGLVIAEAAESGLPIVVTSQTGAVGERSHARVGHNAITYITGDVDSLSLTLASLANDQRHRYEMSQESRQIAAEMRLACIDGVARAVRR
jgi:glycosyltransferase involved in cell wall biosynthesis